MATIKVDLNAFYGYGHGGGCYGSNETIEVEINDQELDALRKLGAKEISCEAVMETIESGDTTLQSLHKRLEEKFYYMVEEYWLYEADNECLHESLRESFNADVKSGIYPPVSFDDFIEWFETGDIDSSEKLSDPYSAIYPSLARDDGSCSKPRQGYRRRIGSHPAPGGNAPDSPAYLPPWCRDRADRLLFVPDASQRCSPN